LKVAVVGAGIAGTSAARRLAENSHRVTVFEQFPAGHTLGSSHGRSRIIRRAYPDPFYTAIMQDGYPLWAELEQASVTRLVSEVGLLYFGRTDSADLARMIDGLSSLAVPHEVLSEAAMGRRFPALAFRPGEIGVFTPEAGYVNADGAVAATRRLAAEGGCEFVELRVGPADLDEFDRVVVCAGPWVTDWWSAAPVRVTLQTVAYIRGDLDGPVWIEESADFLYGFPSGGEGSFKVGVHSHGPPADPNNPARTPNPRHLELITAVARDRLGIVEPEVTEVVVCLYTNSPDENFLIHRPDSRTMIVSACSGHGFKFGPWIGKLIADVIDGKEDMQRYRVFLK
jgi:sarcosine oxidase